MVGLFGLSKGTTVVPPPDMVERAEVRTPVAGSNQVTAESADLTVAAAGPTGPRTASSSIAGPNIGQLIVLNPQNPG